MTTLKEIDIEITNSLKEGNPDVARAILVLAGAVNQVAAALNALDHNIYTHLEENIDPNTNAFKVKVSISDLGLNEDSTTGEQYLRVEHCGIIEQKKPSED